jgi:hypothetical protein
VPKTLSRFIDDGIGSIGALVALICFVLATLISPFKSKLRLEAENAGVQKKQVFGMIRDYLPI